MTTSRQTRPLLVPRQRQAFHKPVLTNQRPSRHKLFFLTWLAIYPLITIMLHFFGKYLNLLPLPIRTLLLTGVLVYLMTYWVMPMLMKLFRDWL